MPRPKKSSYPSTKPSYSYVALCTMAIESSPSKRMTLQEIYKFVSERFAYYNGGNERWKNSLRHNLSFNDCFVKLEMESTVPRGKGRKGSYWTLHPNCREMFCNGSALRRKRRFRETDIPTREAESKSAQEEESFELAEGIGPKTEQHFSDGDYDNSEQRMNPDLLYDWPCVEQSYYGRSALPAPSEMANSSSNAAKKKPKNSSRESALRKRKPKPSIFTIESILNSRRNGEEGNQDMDEIRANQISKQSLFNLKLPAANERYSRSKCTSEESTHTSYRYQFNEMTLNAHSCQCFYCQQGNLTCRCEQCAKNTYY